MAFKAVNVRLSYENTSLLAEKDSVMLEYTKFKKRFGEDGNVFVIGIKNPDIFTLKQFNAWYDLANDIQKIDGVQGIVSITKGFDLYKNEGKHQFDLLPIVNHKPSSQAEVDSIKNQILDLKFYQGLLYNPKTHATLLAITLDKSKMDDKRRIVLVEKIIQTTESYHLKNNVEVHYSGIPYIRTVTMKKIQHELFLFIMMSLGIAALIMLLFFRSKKVVLVSLLIVGISIVWVLGITSLFNYKITILTGVIPSLIVIIAIENCIYILNKYHWEYRSHGNKIKALTRVVETLFVRNNPLVTAYYGVHKRVMKQK
jgi:predicted RND superfamily exporter protein